MICSQCSLEEAVVLALPKNSIPRDAAHGFAASVGNAAAEKFNDGNLRAAAEIHVPHPVAFTCVGSDLLQSEDTMRSEYTNILTSVGSLFQLLASCFLIE